jgi:hypothetical protein
LKLVKACCKDGILSGLLKLFAVPVPRAVRLTKPFLELVLPLQLSNFLEVVVVVVVVVVSNPEMAPAAAGDTVAAPPAAAPLDMELVSTCLEGRVVFP